MKANPKKGDSYFQELARGVAEDQAKILGVDAKVRVPYGTFQNCLATQWLRRDHGLREPSAG